MFKNMCVLIAQRVWEKIIEFEKLDPLFNSNNDADFKKAIKNLSIYDIKADFLIDAGFDPSWGCPNEVTYSINKELF